MNTQLHRSVRWGLSLMLGLLLTGLVAPPLFAAGPAPARPANPQFYFLRGDATNTGSGTTFFQAYDPGEGWDFATQSDGIAVMATCWQTESEMCEGLYADSPQAGVDATASSDTGVGLNGHAAGRNLGFGLVGRANSRSGTGVYGTTTAYVIHKDGQIGGWGVYGHAISDQGIGVAGIAPSAGVFGSHNPGFYRQSNAVGVEGDATSTSGLANGVYGHTASPEGFGVVGTSPYVGVYGKGTGSGSFGVYVMSLQGTGLSAYSSLGRGAIISTNTGLTALEASNPNTGSGHYAIVADGDVLVKGNLYTTKGGPVPYSPVTTDQGPRAMYAAAGTRTLLSDQGTGRLVAGRAVIALDPLYAQTVDLSADYQVFLTPSGADTLGLTVVNKTATSFEVRELRGGHGTYRFDWRIDAVRKGYATTRMAAAPPDPAAPTPPVAPVAPHPSTARPTRPHPVAPAAPPPGAAGGSPRSPTR